MILQKVCYNLKFAKLSELFDWLNSFIRLAERFYRCENNKLK